MYKTRTFPKYELVILTDDPLENLKNLNIAGDGNVTFRMHYEWDDGYAIYETDSGKMIDMSKPYCVFMYDGTFIHQYETKEEFDEDYENE